MRGLTPKERSLLVAPNGFVAKDQSEFDALDKLFESGRVLSLERGDWTVSELGRLALRVCPVDEP